MANTVFFDVPLDAVNTVFSDTLCPPHVPEQNDTLFNLREADLLPLSPNVPLADLLAVAAPPADIKPTLPALPMYQDASNGMQASSTFLDSTLLLPNAAEIDALLEEDRSEKAERQAEANARISRSRQTSINRVIEGSDLADDHDIEVALSYGSRQGIALNKANGKRRRSDEDVHSEQDRLEKNRQSARECRLRKKAYIRGLELKASRLEAQSRRREQEMQRLRTNLRLVRDRYTLLANQVKRLQN